MRPDEVHEILRADPRKKVLVVIGSGVDVRPFEPHRAHAQVCFRDIEENDTGSVLGSASAAFVIFVGLIPKTILAATARRADAQSIRHSGEKTWHPQTAAAFLRGVFKEYTDKEIRRSGRNSEKSALAFAHALPDAPVHALPSHEESPGTVFDVSLGQNGDGESFPDESIEKGDRSMKKKISLREFVRTRADFSKPAGEEIQHLFSLAKQGGMKTTKNSVAFTFYAVRKEAGKSGTRNARQAPSRRSSQPRSSKGNTFSLEVFMKYMEEARQHFEQGIASLREAMGVFPGSVAAIQSKNQELQERIDRMIRDLKGE